LKHNQQEQYFLLKYVAVVLLLAILLPSAVKFTHVFEDHKHEVCTDYSTNHMHEIDLECEFFKFKLNTQYYTLLENFDLIIEDNFFKIKDTYYNFQFNYQQLSYSLRGPPFVV